MIRLCKLLLFAATLILKSEGWSGAEPAMPSSGIIHTADTSGERSERILFSGLNTRQETYIGKHLTRVIVTGAQSWVAYPAAGRIDDYPQDGKPQPYPAQVQQGLAFFERHSRPTKALFKGFPCWKYAWHEPERQVGCVGSSAHDVAYWVYANPQFPATLKYQPSIGAGDELLSLQLNCPIAQHLFERPKGLLPIRSFSLPQAPFSIECQSSRVSTQYGWKENSTETFKWDRRTLTRTYTSTTIHEDGSKTTFRPKAETFDQKKGYWEVWGRMASPDSWFTLRKVGHESLLGLSADVLEDLVLSPNPTEKYWVVNHPVLGTICLRKITAYPGDTTDSRVVQINIKVDER
ncbi:MAG: hypothetical protein M3347_01775 [Armatimonadota bacterium]|nr:hypothetical protein [Armatimonadota bacterium]